MAVLECRLKPWNCFAWNKPNKNGFLTWKHLLSEPLAIELSFSQVPALERSGKPQVLLCKCILWNKTETLLRAKMNMCAIHLFRAMQSANHPLHHLLPWEKLLSNNLCYSREPGLCFCATLREHETFFFSIKVSMCKSSLEIWNLLPFLIQTNPSFTPPLTVQLPPFAHLQREREREGEGN